VGVLGEEQRLEAAFLGGARKLRRWRGLIGRENRQSELLARYRSTK
jgi:hypothetical protein